MTSDAGTNAELRKKVASRIHKRAHLLYDRKGSIGEWEEFLTEAANGQPITNLHVRRPTAAIPEPVGRPVKEIMHGEL